MERCLTRGKRQKDICLQKFKLQSQRKVSVLHFCSHIWCFLLSVWGNNFDPRIDNRIFFFFLKICLTEEISDHTSHNLKLKQPHFLLTTANATHSEPNPCFMNLLYAARRGRIPLHFIDANASIWLCCIFKGLVQEKWVCIYFFYKYAVATIMWTKGQTTKSLRTSFCPILMIILNVTKLSSPHMHGWMLWVAAMWLAALIRFH